MRNMIIIVLLAATSLWADPTMTETRQRIVETALGFKGVPYVYGAESPEAFDCSGFVHFVYLKGAELSIPRNSRQQWVAGFPVTMDQIKPGDVFVFDTVGGAPSHVAIYLGNESMIQAVSEGRETGVIVSSTKDHYWAPRLLGERSFLDKPGPVLAQAGPQTPAAVQKQAAPAAPAAAAPVAAAPLAPAAPQPPATAAALPKPSQAPTTPRSVPPTAPVQSLSPPPGATAAPLAPPPLVAAPGVRPAATAQPEQAVCEIGFTLRQKPEVVTDRIPTAIGTMLEFTITNDTGRDDSFQIDFYRAEVDMAKNLSLSHQVVSIVQGGHLTIEPYLFSESGTYRLNVKTKGNTQLMQRSFQVVRIGKGGAFQTLGPGQGASAKVSAAGVPAGTPTTKVGIILESAALVQAPIVELPMGTAIAFRVANGTGKEGAYQITFYKADPNPRNNLVLRESRVTMPKGSWEELESWLLTEPGLYRLIVKTADNELVAQRDYRVGAKR